jgi:hypothetical protein
MLLLVAAIHLLILHQYYKNKKFNTELKGKMPEKTNSPGDQYTRINVLSRTFNDSLTSGETKQNDFLYALYFSP